MCEQKVNNSLQKSWKQKRPLEKREEDPMDNNHFISLSTFQIMAMFRRGLFYLFLSIYLKEYLGVSNTVMTLYATLPMIANITAQTVIWGRISDKFLKRRSLIIFGEIYAAIGYLVVYLIHKDVGQNSLIRAAYTIIIGFTVVEAGWSASNLGWTTLIADLTTEKERSTIMGRLQFIGGIGNIIGVTTGGFLYNDGAGFWNGTLFYVSSGIMLLSIFALFLIPESYADLEKKPEEVESGIGKTSLFSSIEETKDDVSIKPRKVVEWDWKLLVWLLVVLAIVNIGGNSINQMLQIYVRLPYVFGASDQIIAQMRNTSSVAMIIAGLIIGYFTTKFGDHNLLLVGFLMIFVATLSLPFMPHVAFVFVYMALLGSSRVFIQTTSYAMVNKIVPLKIRGKMMGYYNATFYLSWGLGGTLITGPVADAIVKPNISVIIAYVSLGMILLGITIYLLVQRHILLNIKKVYSYIVGAIIFVITGLSIVFKAETVSRLILSFNEPDEFVDGYAYETTFFIATWLIGLGIVVYMLIRPLNYKLFIEKNRIKPVLKE